MKKTSPSQKQTKIPAFVTRAERSMRRVALKVQAQHRALNLPLIVWENGKVVEKPA